MAEIAQSVSPQSRPLIRQIGQSTAVMEVVRFIVAIAVALAVFSVLLLVQSRNPIETYQDIFNSTLGSSYGRSEVGVKMIPLLLCALAVAVPARVGLVNVGGEGQLYIGALFASWAALTFTDLPRYLMLPFMLVLSVVGGALVALGPALLRARGWMNETISTLLLNYVAILVVQYLCSAPGKTR
jgi:ABC-type uncharacterized transport system permease subunit